MTKKKDKREGQRYNSPLFMGMGLVAAVCIMLLFVGTGVASATDYYVSLSGKNSNDGDTLDAAWRTIAYAAAKAEAGDTVHIKGGNYGQEQVVIKNSGTAANPIVFEGFDGTPVIDRRDMSGTGISIDYKDYITLRNINVTKYKFGVLVADANYITMDNINVAFIRHTGVFIKRSEHCTVQNSEIIDAGENNILLAQSHYCLVENCDSIGEDSSIAGDDDGGTDYYIIIIYGHDNIIRDCLSHNKCGQGHSGHGIGIKDNYANGVGYYAPHSYNNKIINCTCRGNYEAFFIRHFAYDNEVIGCTAYEGIYDYCKGMTVGDGAYNNTFADCRTYDLKYGIDVTETGENPESCPPENNKFIRCITSGGENAIRFESGRNTQFNNCVFDGTYARFIKFRVSQTQISFRNCIVTNMPEWSSGTGNPTFTYSGFYNNGFSMPSGTGNINADPLFVDPAKGNYHLQSDSPCINAGAGGVDMGAYPEGESRDAGAIAGTVTDGTNPIQGAAVTADGYSDPDGTDSNGYYEISDVPVGAYTVTASASGYPSKSEGDVKVSKDQTTTVNFQFPVAETPEAPGAPGFVGNWQFEEGSGRTAYDSSDYGNDGTITDAEYTTSSKIGEYALKLDGVDDYVEIEDDDSLDGFTAGATFICWVKSDDLPDSNGERQTLLSKYNTAENQRAWFTEYRHSGGELRIGLFFSDDGQTYHNHYAPVKLSEGKWHHIAVEWIKDETSRIWVDGELQKVSIGDGSTTSSIYDSIAPLIIGKSQYRTDREFIGTMDEVKIYNGVLSADEIRAEYEAGSKTETEAPVGNWHFDEGAGTTAYDSSDYGNDGTITGADYTTSSKIGESALLFDGQNDYVYIEDDDSLDGFTAGATFICWVKSDDLPDSNGERQTLLSKYDRAENQRAWFTEYRHSGGELRIDFFFSDDGQTYHNHYAPVKLSEGKWHHIAVEWIKDETSRIWVDGEPQEVYLGDGSTTSSIYNSVAPLIIGKSQYRTDRDIKGTIDEVTIYNRVLSADEIRAEYVDGE